MKISASPTPKRDSALLGGGAMGALMRAHDWAATPVGLPEAWPQPLKTLVGVMLAAEQPMFVAWGPGHILLYNDSYAPMLANRHPNALGRPFFDVWSEVRGQLTPLFDRVFAGEPVHMDDIALHLDRPGRPSEAHFAFSYTPVQDEDGMVVGLFCPCRETTERVLAERNRAAEAERHRILLQRMPGFVGVLTGPDHVYEYVNDAYVAVSGPRRFNGRTVRQVFPELEGQGFFELLDHVYATGEPFAARAMPIRLTGEMEERYIDLLYQPIRSDGGEITGIFVGGYDVTERMRTEKRRAALLELDERLRDLSDTADMAHASSRLLGEALGVSRVGYGVIDPAAGTITIERSWNAPSVASLAGLYRFSDYGSHIEDLRRGLHVMNHDVETDPRTAAAAGALTSIAIRAFLDMPVVEQGRTAAMLFVHSPVPRAWTDEEAVLVREVAERTWATIQRVRAERALRALNADLERQVIERTQARGRTWQVSPDLMGALNAEGRFETSNPAWQTVLGWSEAEVAGMSIWEMLHPDDLEPTRAGFALNQTGQPSIQFPNRYRCKDGSYRWISWTGVPEDGRTYYTGRDITADKQREAALAERTAERDRMWETSSDLMLIIDHGGIFRRVNPAWTTLLGYAPDELVGYRFTAFVFPDDHDATIEAYRIAAPPGHPAIENRYRHKDGSLRWISWIAAPVGDMTYATGRDVTAEKTRQAELEAAQQALRQSQKMEAVGQLTGGIAHDFNNLLTGIMGSLEILQRRTEEGRFEQLQRYTTVALASAQRAAALTQRLLAFSRRQPLDPRPVEANRLIASMEEMLRRTLGPSTALELVLAGGLWPTLCDPNQIENAILNLAINARDAMPQGGRLTMETSNAHLDAAYARAEGGEVEPGQYVAIAVTDTGVGIPQHLLQRIFEPFFTTKPIGQGTGLGLSQLYGFAKQSGGHVKVYSEPGQGTTFRLYLPRHRGTVTEAEIAGGETEQPARAQIGETVLVVDDEAAIRMLITEMLEELGYAALEAVDGPSGLTLLQSDARIDLLVTDVGLPGLNGRQLADAARMRRPDLKILFITGFAGNAAVGNGVLDAGMEMLTKPFAMDQLASKIREIMESR